MSDQLWQNRSFLVSAGIAIGGWLFVLLWLGTSGLIELFQAPTIVVFLGLGFLGYFTLSALSFVGDQRSLLEIVEENLIIHTTESNGRLAEVANIPLSSIAGVRLMLFNGDLVMLIEHHGSEEAFFSLPGMGGQVSEIFKCLTEQGLVCHIVRGI
ncbi:MAG: hypothetical protein K2W95_07045 [Candidatus Obscuribacterales bacterium]|nr:hypothetical protein [Candidatus Obscuribacterales bacterium]